MTAPDGDQRRTSPQRTRGWIAIGIAAAVVLGLSIAVFTQQPAGSSDTAASGPETVTVTVTPTPEQSPDAAPEPAPDPAPEPDPAPDSSGDTGGDVVGEAVQEEPVTAPTDGEKAPPIGPFGDLAQRIPDDPFAVGEVDAPVTMVMFSDYRCPFCALFSQTLEPQLVDKYVNPGVLRIEWRDFPIFGDESIRAAVAGRAAGIQGKFWEFNSTLYAAAPDKGHPSYSDAQLIAFAEQAGVADMARFTADLDDPELATLVQEDFEQGADLGVPATPSFIINGYPLRGAQPLTEFEQLIDTVAELATQS